MENKNERNQLIVGRGIGIVLIVVFVFFSAKSCIEQKSTINEINRNAALTVGEIIEYGEKGKGRDYLIYTYMVDSVAFTERIALRYRIECARKHYKCEGRKFRVIYSKKNPQKSYMLVEKYGCDLFGLPLDMAKQVK